MSTRRRTTAARKHSAAEEGRVLAARTTAAQGLQLHVNDPRVLAQVASMVAATKQGGGANAA